MSMIDNIIRQIADILIDFKTDKQRTEWSSGKLSQNIINIVLILAFVSYLIFQKKIMITEIFRTQEENNKIYGDTKHISTHTYYRAVDLRTSIYTANQASFLSAIANCFQYDPKRPAKNTALYGDKLHLNHIHLQVLS